HRGCPQQSLSGSRRFGETSRTARPARSDVTDAEDVTGENAILLLDRLPAGPALDDGAQLGLGSVPPPPHPLQPAALQDHLFVEQFPVHHGLLPVPRPRPGRRTPLSLQPLPAASSQLYVGAGRQRFAVVAAWGWVQALAAALRRFTREGSSA